MTLSVGLALLLGLATALLIGLEVTREIGPEHRPSQLRVFVVGVVAGTVVAALVAVVALFRTFSS